MTASPDLLRATLETIILEVIEGGATYGYEIAQAIERESGGQLLAQEGTLYPALHRLEKRGYLRATWKTSPEGRRRKHYHLTALGQKRREEARRQWKSFSETVNRILGVTYVGFACP